MRTRLLICSACLLSLAGMAFCQSTKDYLITAQRSGTIQFRDAVTLNVISSIDVVLPADSTGVNGVWADPNGQTLYIDGPEHSDPNGASGCCWLYAIDLPSGQATVAADIWGSNFRRHFVNAGSSLLTTISEAALKATQMENDRWQIPPDGRWWAGLRSGPAVDLYDATRNKIVHSLRAQHGNADWPLNGAWIKDQFYIYSTHDGSGWLWHVSPDSDRLGEPDAVPDPTFIQGCENSMVLEMKPVGDRLVLNEVFGGKMDRRQDCDGVAGGAWIIDPASMQPVRNIASQFHFWRLIPSQDGASLYGVTSDAPVIAAPAQLVRLDAHSGKILQIRVLEGDYWWIAAARLRSIPVRSKSLLLPIENTH